MVLLSYHICPELFPSLYLSSVFTVFRVKGKKLYFGFADLEKAFDRLPREVISWTTCKLGVEEWLVSAVMSMYRCKHSCQNSLW